MVTRQLAIALFLAVADISRFAVAQNEGAEPDADADTQTTVQTVTVTKKVPDMDKWEEDLLYVFCAFVIVGSLVGMFYAEMNYRKERKKKQLSQETQFEEQDSLEPTPIDIHLATKLGGAAAAVIDVEASTGPAEALDQVAVPGPGTPAAAGEPDPLGSFPLLPTVEKGGVVLETPMDKGVAARLSGDGEEGEVRSQFLQSLEEVAESSEGHAEDAGWGKLGAPGSPGQTSSGGTGLGLALSAAGSHPALSDVAGHPLPEPAEASRLVGVMDSPPEPLSPGSQGEPLSPGFDAHPLNQSSLNASDISVHSIGAHALDQSSLNASRVEASTPLDRTLEGGAAEAAEAGLGTFALDDSLHSLGSLNDSFHSQAQSAADAATPVNQTLNKSIAEGDAEGFESADEEGSDAASMRSAVSMGSAKSMVSARSAVSTSSSQARTAKDSPQGSSPGPSPLGK